MSWGKPTRPAINYGKVNSPSPREGVDGDIQVRQSNLGARLFGKISGKWYHTPLTATDGNPVTRFGTGLSNYLSIDNNSVDIFKNKVKVAEFGEEVIIGEVGASKSNVQITSGVINLRNNTTNKIALDASGDIKLSGKLIVGKEDGTFNATDNIVIGSDQSILGLQNISLGYQSGKGLTGTSGGSSSLTNVLIGYVAGTAVDTGQSNICIGTSTGDNIVGGGFNIMIGHAATTDANGNERISIGRSVSNTTDETIRIGDSGNYLFFNFSSNSGGATTVTSDERVKTNITDTDIGLDFIKALRPIKYTGINKQDYPDELFQNNKNIFKDEQRKADPSKRLEGFIAQDVKKVMDNLGVEFSGWHQNKSSRQMLSYSTFVVPLTKAVQELSAKIDTMQTEINNLKG